ncbi:MAG: type II toxin-antitoxin system Phd/YefM family antitoxin [Burkholderiales bacterium]|nr:type II toxin-antitoxin system Phd/YefM family antitoxin [Burkholderiales bacterium]
MEIPAGLFKARCLKLMDEVESKREEIVITKRGKPVAKLVPVDEKPSPVFGRMKGTVIEHGDIVAPLDEEWTADAGNIR